MNDYITCRRCGKVVPRGHKCPYKRDYKPKEDTISNRFRASNKWKVKSIHIKERDKYLCRVCLDNKYNTINQLNYTNLEVHHIIPIKLDYDKRMDDDNLITLCQYHHKLADSGEIPKEYLHHLATRPISLG